LTQRPASGAKPKPSAPITAPLLHDAARADAAAELEHRARPDAGALAHHGTGTDAGLRSNDGTGADAGTGADEGLCAHGGRGMHLGAGFDDGTGMDAGGWLRTRARRPPLREAREVQVGIGCHQRGAATGQRRVAVLGPHDHTSGLAAGQLRQQPRLGQEADVAGAGSIERRDRLDALFGVTVKITAQRGDDLGQAYLHVGPPRPRLTWPGRPRSAP
jgi:hypothetical protein